MAKTPIPSRFRLRPDLTLIEHVAAPDPKLYEFLRNLLFLVATKGGLDNSVLRDPTAAGGGHIIQDEGISLPTEPELDFIGNGVKVVDNPGSSATEVHISDWRTQFLLVEEWAGGIPNHPGDYGWERLGGHIAYNTGVANEPGGFVTQIKVNESTPIDDVWPADDTHADRVGLFLPAAFFDYVFRFEAPSGNSDNLLYVGLSADPVPYHDPPDAGIYFRKAFAETNWFAVCRDAFVETATDTGVAVSTALVTFRIRRSGVNIIFSIAGVDVATISANIPTHAVYLQKFWGCLNTAPTTYREAHRLDVLEIPVARS